jgi:DNA-binding NarL/FixJ family response regulator
MRAMVASPIRLLLVDDHCMFLQALKLALEADGRFSIVGTADNVAQGVELVQTLRPEIVVSDIQFPDGGVFQLMDDLDQKHLPIRLAILTGFVSDALIESALRVGARGYFMKTDPIHELTASLLAIAAGETRFSASIRDRVVQNEDGAWVGKHETLLSRLTTQQIEVLRHLARGLSVKEVARLMHVTVKAVDSQKYRLMKSLGIHDRVLLAHFALEHGLIAADQPEVIAP